MPTQARRHAFSSLSIAAAIARELGVAESQTTAAIELIDDGATVPFIARYRKERTGGLDDTQLRTLAERLTYLTALADRRETVLKSLRDQHKLTPEMERQINAAETRAALEDLYAPFKPKRRTKAMIAREAGLDVDSQQVVLGEAEAADGCLGFYSAVRAMPVVSVGPDWEVCGALV